MRIDGSIDGLVGIGVVDNDGPQEGTGATCPTPIAVTDGRMSLGVARPVGVCGHQSIDGRLAFRRRRLGGWVAVCGGGDRLRFDDRLVKTTN